MNGTARAARKTSAVAATDKKQLHGPGCFCLGLPCLQAHRDSLHHKHHGLYEEPLAVAKLNQSLCLCAQRLKPSMYKGLHGMCGVVCEGLRPALILSMLLAALRRVGQLTEARCRLLCGHSCGMTLPDV